MAEAYVDLKGIITKPVPMLVRPIDPVEEGQPYIVALDMEVKDELNMGAERDAVIEIVLTQEDVDRIVAVAASRCN